jgi:hypothetical protein
MPFGPRLSGPRGSRRLNARLAAVISREPGRPHDDRSCSATKGGRVVIIWA